MRSARSNVDAHDVDEPLSPGVGLGALATALGHPADQLRAALEDLDSLAVEQGVVVDPSRTQRAADTDAGRALIALLDASPFAPPEPPDPVLARALVREGALVDVDGLVFTTGALTLAARLAA